MATTTASTSCGSFFSFRLNSVKPPRTRSAPGPGSSGCGKPDKVGMWLINGLAAAFFASLDRCSCIRIKTEEDGDEATELPLLMIDDGNTGRRGRGKKSRSD